MHFPKQQMEVFNFILARPVYISYQISVIPQPVRDNWGKGVGSPRLVRAWPGMRGCPTPPKLPQLHSGDAEDKFGVVEEGKDAGKETLYYPLEYTIHTD